MMTERESLICFISDTYKDLHNVRPHFAWDRYTVEELHSLLDDLQEDLEADIYGDDCADVLEDFVLVEEDEFDLLCAEKGW